MFYIFAVELLTLFTVITSFNNRIRKETSARNILGENVIFNLNYLVVSGILLERERKNI